MDNKTKIDFEMYQDFIKEYNLDKLGGIQLLRILLNRILNIESLDEEADDKFINYYVTFFHNQNKPNE